MASSFLLGVNLSGAEFGSNVPGVFGTDYTYPTHAEIDYYASKGLGVIRLPFLWERMQHTEFGTLDPTELGRLTDVVNYATSKGLKIEIEPHDFGYGFGALIGSAQTPNSAFADFWGKLAQQFEAHANVIFGLMNEPHDQSATAWLGSANAAIAAIRGAGAVSQEILVPGSYWDGAWTWTSTDNAAVVGTGVQDPAHNFAFEVHQYLDSDGSGTHPGAISATIGVERLTAITQWAEATGNHLFLGEVGVTTDQTSLTALDGMLTYMQQHTDAWQGATYWAGGPWWGNYMFSIEPQNGVDKPQMAILEEHLANPAPTVKNEIVTPTSGGTVGLNQTVTIELDMSEAVVVVGTPKLTLNDGGFASYMAASSLPSTGKLIFQYKVTAGQNAKDLQITGASLPSGASIKDDAGNTANLAAAKADLKLLIDSVLPKLSSVTKVTSPSGIEVESAGTVTIKLNMSELVNVTGSPELKLNDGAVASYLSGTGSKTLTFTYQVGSETTADLRVTGIDQSNGSITDAAGNPLSSTLSKDLKLAINTDSWRQGVSGTWTDATKWVSAVPDANHEGSIAVAGTYKVTSPSDTIVAALKVANPTATLAIAGGTFTAANGTGVDANAGTISVQSGAKLVLGGPVTNNGTIATAGTLQVQGALTGNGRIKISGAGQAEIALASSEKVTFAAGATGTLTLDDSQHYGGKITGFGLKNSPKASIDLTDIGFVQNVTSRSYDAPTGILTVDDHAGHAAQLKFNGSYVQGNFNIQSDNHGGTLLTDPPVAGSASPANIALLSNYMAASFVKGVDSYGGALISEAMQAANQLPVLTPPHA